MAKRPTITTVDSGYTSQSTINTNFENVRDQFDNTLSLDGSTPNSLGADLDMNNNDILNAKAVNTANLYIGGTKVVPTDVAYSAVAITKEYDTVAELLADTATYTAGLYFHVIEGDFYYKSAASGDVTNAGSQQFEVLPGASDYNVKAFGAVGDGVTDNSAALLALRDHLISKDREKHWTVYFPPGDYHYSNNRWLNGLLRVTIEAYHATLTCTQVGNFSGDGWPFGPREQMFRATGERLVDDVGFAVDLGDRINTANIGDSTITLTTASDADNYAVGDRIFIFSYSLGNVGYSPNFRYFEWAKITSKAGAVLTLGDLVQNPHLSDYPDFLYLGARTIDGTSFPDQFVGKPRIINLEGRPQTDGTEYWYPEQIHIKGARFPQNPNTLSSYRLALAGRKVLFEDVTVDPEISGGITMGFDLRESEFTEALRCSADTIEIDKLLYHTEIDGCTFGDTDATSLTGGTSSKTVIVKNSSGSGVLSAKALDAIIIEGNQFSSVGRSNTDTNGPYMPGFPGGTGAALAVVNGNTALMDTEHEPVGLQMLLVSAVAPGLDAADGTIVETYDSSTFYTLTGITPGKLIWLASEPRVKGIVQDVILDGLNVKVRFKSGNFPESIKSGYITGTPTYAWSANDKLYLDGELWNPKGRLEDVETGLLDWSKLYVAAGYDINGVDLVGDGTGGITNQTGFSRIVNGNQTYRLTYDMARTAGSVIIRDGSSGSNLATINATATGATVDFTTSANGRDVQFRPSGFNGTFTPIKLERL